MNNGQSNDPVQEIERATQIRRLIAMTKSELIAMIDKLNDDEVDKIALPISVMVRKIFGWKELNE